MRKEWLQDYSQSETEAYEKFLKNWVDLSQPPPTPWPPRERFADVKSPTAWLASPNIWGQLPMYGTSFVHLHALQEEKFFSRTNIQGRSELYHLLDLARDGRVAFVIDSDPIDFEPYDYLEPFFQELRPPRVFRFPIEQGMTEQQKKDFEISKVEFVTLATKKLVPYMAQFRGISPEDSLSNHIIQGEIRGMAASYAALKFFGFSEAAVELVNLLVRNGAGTISFLKFIEDFELKQLDPLRICYNASLNLSANDLREETISAKDAFPNMKAPIEAALPHEIGRLLVRKLSFLPEGFDSCISIMSDYDANGIHHLVGGIESGIISKKIDIINGKAKELSEAFDNMWKEADKIAARAKFIGNAFMVTLGVAGLVATLPEFGVGGLAVAAGFQVFDQRITRISERIAKLGKPGYLIAIHDFKEDYSIPKKLGTQTSGS